MKKLILLVFIFLNSLNLYAQIDTSVYYPLNTGDYREYAGRFYDILQHIYVTVKGDTLMPNQKQYKILEKVDEYQGHLYTHYDYQRVEDGYKVFEYVPVAPCHNSERLIYDLSKADIVFWDVCPWRSLEGEYCHTVIQSGYAAHPAFPILLPLKIITSLAIVKMPIGNVDTLWESNPSLGTHDVAKGVGLIRFSGEFSPEWTLTGAVINGVSYGYFTDVKREENISVSDYKLLVQAYPNPFNPSTTIKILNTKDSNIDVKIYDVLGREVTRLYKGYVKDETLSLKFDAGSLPSGTYILVAKSNYSVSTTKLVLVK